MPLWHANGELYLSSTFRPTHASLRILYLFACNAVYEHQHLGPDADVFCLSKISVRQFDFVSFLFPHEVHTIRSETVWYVCLYVSFVKLVNGLR
jgi:hypothetical protein